MNTVVTGGGNSDIENITVVARSGENFIDLQGLSGMQSLTIGGAGSLDTATFNNVITANPSANFSSLTQVDASTALGSLDLALFSDVAMTDLKAGFGDDVIRAGSNIRSSTVLNGGDGDDVLMLSGIEDVVGGTNNVTLTPNMTGFETIDLQLEGSVETFTLSLASTEGLNTIQVSNELGIDNDPGDTVSTTIRDLDGPVSYTHLTLPTIYSV